MITRILEWFAETYLQQWQENKDSVTPTTAFANSDSVLQVAVSLIMLNTSLHVVPKKVKRQSVTNCAPCRTQRLDRATSMSPSDYILNTRRVVCSDEVPDEALRNWYDTVSEEEISVEPLPRVDFSMLPVQPDIEGWLVVVVGPRVRRRMWSVLALQRMYLFSDAGSDIEPFDVVDLKDARISALSQTPEACERLRADLGRGRLGIGRCCAGVEDLPDLERHGFEVRWGMGGKKAAALPRLGRATDSLFLLAETPNLTNRWVNLISSGRYR